MLRKCDNCGRVQDTHWNSIESWHTIQHGVCSVAHGSMLEQHYCCVDCVYAGMNRWAVGHPDYNDYHEPKPPPTKG